MLKKARILWICNKKPAKVSIILNHSVDSFGGWLDSTCETLMEMDMVELYILFPDDIEYEGNWKTLSFFSFDEKNCRSRFLNVIGEIYPDVIHVWGTEFVHSNEALKACEQLNLIERCVVSIQGLVSLCGRYHFTEGLPNKVVKSYTLHDFLKQDNIAKSRERFIRRGIAEIEALRRTNHIIGRTDWDKAASQMFNPHAKYHFCNESLRRCFYENTWEIDKIVRNSIFVSQCSYAIKGFHYLLEAMPEILKRHSNAHIYIAGTDLLNLSIKQRLLISSYQRYLLKLIKKNRLQEHVTFLGNLCEKEMCRQYLRANVFVSSSTIENSSNSVGEAMLVGCPVVTSDVGGIKNMLEHGKEGFVYQSSAPYMLAYYVNEIFEDDKLAIKFSENGKIHAIKTHDREVNMETLYGIYTEIMALHTTENLGGGGK